MSKAPSEKLSVTILDRSYQLSCSPEEKNILLECVGLVDARMRKIKAEGKLQAADRIAVMAALTIARDLIANPAAIDPHEKQSALEKIAAINKALDGAIAPQDNLF
jgi:cell division protein ZapA